MEGLGNNNKMEVSRERTGEAGKRGGRDEQHRNAVTAVFLSGAGIIQKVSLEVFAGSGSSLTEGGFCCCIPHRLKAKVTSDITYHIC